MMAWVSKETDSFLYVTGRRRVCSSGHNIHKTGRLLDRTSPIATHRCDRSCRTRHLRMDGLDAPAGLDSGGEGRVRPSRESSWSNGDNHGPKPTPQSHSIHTPASLSPCTRAL